MIDAVDLFHINLNLNYPTGLLATVWDAETFLVGQPADSLPRPVSDHRSQPSELCVRRTYPASGPDQHHNYVMSMLRNILFQN